jgi:hypothetical protein
VRKDVAGRPRRCAAMVQCRIDHWKRQLKQNDAPYASRAIRHQP